MSYLDTTGLTYYHSKIKNNLKSYYGTCETSASTQAKVVTCSGFKLETGAKISVKFSNAQTYNGTATLNVNSTGAKNICRVGTTTTTRYYWSAGEVVDFIYDGTNFIMEGKGLATTTYYGVTKLSSSTSSTSTSLAATPSAVKSAYDLANTANTQATTNATDIGTINTALGGKQATLVSGTNIKTINGQSLLGSGDITIEGGSSEVTDLLNNLFYKAGDTFQITNGSSRYNVSGMLTSSAKSLTFTVFVPKSLKDISSISCSTLKLNVRGVKGYVGASAYVAEGTNFLDGTTLTVAKVSDNAIGITVAAVAAYTNSTNNTPVNVCVENMRLNFS